MSDLAKIIGIIVAIPGFILVVLALILSSWSEGKVIEEILQAFEASSLIIGFISIIGVIVLILSIFILARNTFL